MPVWQRSFTNFERVQTLVKTLINWVCPTRLVSNFSELLFRYSSMSTLRLLSKQTIPDQRCNVCKCPARRPNGVTANSGHTLRHCLRIIGKHSSYSHCKYCCYHSAQCPAGLLCQSPGFRGASSIDGLTQ